MHAEKETPKSTTTTTTARRLVNLEEFDLEFEGRVRRYHWRESARAVCLEEIRKFDWRKETDERT